MRIPVLLKRTNAHNTCMRIYRYYTCTLYRDVFVYTSLTFDTSTCMCEFLYLQVNMSFVTQIWREGEY